MEPASTIITALGGASAVARIAGVHRTRPYSWTLPKSQGGTDGVIPVRHAAKIIAAAQDMGLTITAQDFMPASTGAAE